VSIRCLFISRSFPPLSNTRAIPRQLCSPEKIAPRSKNCIAGSLQSLSRSRALEEDIVVDLARLIWRKQNLVICRTAELAKARRGQIQRERQIGSFLSGDDPGADKQARQELGDFHELIDIGETATLDGLMKELSVADRLQGMISRCVKQLLMVRGVKSLSSAAVSESTPQILRTLITPQPPSKSGTTPNLAST
jgi:hypothetical protein